MQNLWIVVSSSDTSSDKGDGPTLQLPISSLLVLASAQLEDREESWVDCLGWPFSSVILGIAQLGTKIAEVAPLISHRTLTCIRYISAYMFEELWLLVD